MMKYNGLILAVAVLLLGGCAQKVSSPLKTYTLAKEPVPHIKHSLNHNKTLKVAYPQALKEQLSNKIAYSYSSSDYGVYQNSQWSNNIGKLLQGSIIQTLEQSRLYKAVLPYASLAEEDFRLESTIYDFSHHVRGDKSYAVVSIEFALINTYTGKLIKTKRFTYKEFTNSTDAKGYVEATQKIMIKLGRNLINWLY